MRGYKRKFNQPWYPIPRDGKIRHTVSMIRNSPRAPKQPPAPPITESEFDEKIRKIYGQHYNPPQGDFEPSTYDWRRDFDSYYDLLDSTRQHPPLMTDRFRGWWEKYYEPDHPKAQALKARGIDVAAQAIKLCKGKTTRRTA